MSENVGKASEHKTPSRPQQQPESNKHKSPNSCWLYICLKMGKIGEHEISSRRTLMRPVRNFPPIVRLQRHAMRLRPVTVALMHPKPRLPQHRNHRRNPFRWHQCAKSAAVFLSLLDVIGLPSAQTPLPACTLQRLRNKHTFTPPPPCPPS